MPRRAKGPRLYLHPTDRTWLIRDGPVTRRTGCGELDRDGAEKELGRYLSEKFKPVAREGDLSRLTVAEVLTAYGREHAPHTRGTSPMMAGYAITTLLPYWGARTLADVRAATCREYAARRSLDVGNGTIRRELAILSAAINHWHREHGPLTSLPTVTMPPKPPPRDRWLTRSQAALLLAGALGWYREQWCDVATRKVHHRWRRYRGGINRHAARFILLGLHTGTRSGAIKGLQWMPNTSGGWVDLERGVLHRRGAAEEETKKRRPPVRLGRRMLSHLRRWKAIDEAARAAARERAREQGQPEPVVYLHLVAWKGGAVAGIRSAWGAAVELAGLDAAVTPHVLRHTRATWSMQAGYDPWQVAGFLGMSVQMLQDVYGHHHPDFQKDVAEA